MKEGEALVSFPMLLLDVMVSSVSQVNLFSCCHKSPFTLSSLSSSCSSLLIERTMLVFGTLCFIMMLFGVVQNHYPIDSMGSGSSVNPLALNSLAKKKWSAIWEVLKKTANTLWEWVRCSVWLRKAGGKRQGFCHSAFSTFCWARDVFPNS